MTYFVIQNDGRRDGPATEEDLRKWYAEGKIKADSVVEDETGARRRLAQIPGFESEAASSQPLQPTTPMVGGVRGAAWAWSVLAGCVGLCVVVALVGVILYPVYSKASKAAKQRGTLANIKRLSFAVLMYGEDNDGCLPPKMSGVKEVAPLLMRYADSVEEFKTLNPAGGEFLGNVEVAGASAGSFADIRTVPMFYESKAWSDGARAVSWLDGHFKMDRSFDPAKDLKVRKSNQGR